MPGYEDTDGDGRADKETVFADGLHVPIGFELAPEELGHSRRHASKIQYYLVKNTAVHRSAAIVRHENFSSESAPLMGKNTEVNKQVIC